MVKDRNTAIFYTTAVCNLKCKYCLIDKNPALKKIDDLLDESFKGDYYFNFTKELFPDKNQLRRIEIWGGEPYLGMHRLYYTLEKLLGHYPNLNEVFGSTNLVSTNFIPEFTGLLKVLGKANHPVTMRLQLSIDGTPDINDYNRGEGVTKKFSERLIEISKAIPDEIPDNVQVEMFFKPTLSIDSLRDLDSKEKIINYFLFFEKFYDLYEKIDCPKLHLRPSLPNFAMPSEFTQNDGFLFRDFCKNTREIERMNPSPFKYFKVITLFNNGYGQETMYDCMSGMTGLCGTGHSNVGLLPNRQISACHMAFVDLLAEYKKEMLVNQYRQANVDENMFKNYFASMLCYPVEKLDAYEAMIDDFYKEGTKAKVATVANEIWCFAQAGQIQAKYKDPKEAVKGANFILTRCPFCIKDNYGTTGSLYSGHAGTIRVFLNGAEDYITGETK